MKELQEHINQETKEDITKLYDHAKIANQEMSVIKTDIAWIKDWIKSADYKLWTIILLIVAALIKLFIK